MIGVNVYGLREKCGNGLDSLGRALAEAGLDAVELFIIPLKRQRSLPIVFSTEACWDEVIRTFRKYGLATPSAHMNCGIGNFFLPHKQTARVISRLHEQYGLDTFVFSGMFRDAKSAKRWASYLSRLADAVAPMNCRILYHNHSQEFTEVTVGGRSMTALDYFFSIAGDKVGLQLDIGWAGICLDEVELAHKYRDRIVSIHLKDFVPGTRGNYENANMPKERFCAIGSGEIRTAEVLAIRETFPNFNGSIIIDQDHSTTDMLEDIRTGYRNVKSML